MVINLSNLMPAPLAEQDTSRSEIWGRDPLQFVAGKRYLIGSPSGKGKSTLLSILFGLRQDYTGDVRMDGEDPRQLSLTTWAAWRQRRLSMVFQGLRLFPQLSGWDNLLMKQQLTGALPEHELRQMARHLGLESLLDQKAGTMSFGQRQRFAIIRALCQPFEWLLLDEPFSHLDASNITRAAELIRQSCEDQQAGLIITTLGETYGLPFDQHFHL